MFILVEVAKESDVGKNEIQRYKLDKDPYIHGWLGEKGWLMENCRGEILEPVITKEV